MEIRRLAGREDVAAVLGFLSRVETATGVAPLGESKFVDLGGPFAGTGFISEGVEIAAYLHLLYHRSSALWEMELAALPGTDEAVLARLVQDAARLAGDRMLWWVFGDTDPSRFARSRFGVLRELHKLAGPLPPAESAELPAGLSIRPFRVDVDEEAWLAVNNAAFAGHPENGAWTRADIEARKRRAWFDVEGFRLAWVGEQLAGFCWTKRHPGTVGEIHVIAVDPAFQGRGIGRAIVVEGLWYLAGTGCTRATLYVDTKNRSALTLYQSLGFGVERVDTCVVVPKGWPHEAQ